MSDGTIDFRYRYISRSLYTQVHILLMLVRILYIADLTNELSYSVQVILTEVLH